MPASDVEFLERLFLPESIAVVGASSTPDSAGRLTLTALRRSFAGTVYAVNSRRTEVLGHTAYPSISALPEVPDLVVISVPANSAVEVIRECVQLGVGGVAVYSSGFAETGKEGARLQAEVRAVLRGSQTRLVGPNAIGYFHASRGTLASFLFAESSPLPQPGPIALASQSGGFAEQLLPRAEDAGLGMDWMISTGNELDVNISSSFEFLLGQQSAEIIVLFAETINDPERFLRCARRAQRIGRPVVMIKTGRSAAGARAATTHTASMAGSDRVFEEACRQFGIIRVETLDEVVDVARALVAGRRSTGNRVAIVTASGGGGVLAADLAEDAGLDVPLLSEPAQRGLRQLVPAFAAVSNPIDVTGKGAENAERFTQVISTVASSPEVDLVACLFSTHGQVAIDVARSIADAYAHTNRPMAVVWGSPEPTSRRILDEAGIPVYTNPRNAVRALAAIARMSPVDAADALAGVRAAAPRSARFEGRSGFVLEDEAQALLAQYGVEVVPRVTARTAEAAATAASELGFPVVMKLVADDVLHREKVGGVALNVTSVEDVRAQFDRLTSISGSGAAAVLLQPQLPRGLELVIGAQRQDGWGSTVLVGLGGTQTELIARSALRLAPLTEHSARSAVAEIFGHHLAPSAVDRAVEVMRAVETIMAEHPQIESLDINPLIVVRDRLVAVDGLISLRGPGPLDSVTDAAVEREWATL